MHTPTLRAALTRPVTRFLARPALSISLSIRTRHLITTPPPPSNNSGSKSQNNSSSTNPPPHTPPTDNQATDAPRINAESRNRDLADDKQSNASREEDKQGGAHPAKRADYQERPERGTGIEGVEREGGN